MTFERAIEIAARAHASKVDRQGEPYILHLIRIALAVPSEARSVAILHDLVEDTEWTFERLAEAGVLAEEEHALRLVTRRAEEGYAEFIERIATAEGGAGELARAVKLADLRDNLGRMPAGEEWARLRKRYKRALARLEPPTE